ncbi:hypothetical protein [Paraburkholderia sediminicola]|uniref:hypothetical protein n=1 Tax=Paraburkholderia sediminicola TaxID=458836 RepID=UPI0038BDF15F
MKRHHLCVIENRNDYRQHVFSMKSIVDALAKNEMPIHTREEMLASLEEGHARAQELIGLYLGMLLQWQPESDKANEMVENFLGEGGNFVYVTDGMKLMSKELKRNEREANPPQGDGGGLSDEARQRMEQTQREMRGHSAHHTTGKLHP